MTTITRQLAGEIGKATAAALAIAIMSQPPQQQVPPPDGVVDDAGREAESYLEWVTRFA